MKRFTLYFTHFILLTSLLACSIQKSSHISEENLSDTAEQAQDSIPANYIGDPMWDPSAKDKIIPVVRRIFQDSRGDIWFAGDWVVRYKNDSLEVFDDEDNFRRLVVRAVKEDQEGNMWFGTSGGIMKYDGDNFQRFSEEDGMTGYDVWSMAIDSKGNIWIGNNGIGVFKYDGEKVLNFTAQQKLREEDSIGGSLGGALSTEEENNGNSLTRVFSIGEDTSGNIWFGTTKSGVWRYDGKTMTNFTKDDGLLSNHIWTIYQSKEGETWFGGAEPSGVYKFNGNSFEQIF